MRVLLIFLDGIGLGEDDPGSNPFAIAPTPTLHLLASGNRWLRATGRQTSARASFVPLSATLGMPGNPQSGTGQAAILTGLNVPQMIGRHYGPKPDAATRDILTQTNLFRTFVSAGRRAQIINAYPPRLHADIARGKTLMSSIQHAAFSAGLPLNDETTLYNGTALSEDFTGAAWRAHLGYTDTPLYSPFVAGQRMVEVARQYDFAFFSHWMTDVIGHRGTLAEAVDLLTVFDGVMAGALSAWDDDEGLMIITSDHGNMEALNHGKHTTNPVPAVIVGTGHTRYADQLNDLTDLAPLIHEVVMASSLTGEA